MAAPPAAPLRLRLICSFKAFPSYLNLFIHLFLLFIFLCFLVVLIPRGGTLDFQKDNRARRESFLFVRYGCLRMHTRFQGPPRSTAVPPILSVEIQLWRMTMS